MNQRLWSITWVGCLSLFILTGCPPKKKLVMEEQPKEEAVEEEKPQDTMDVKEPGISISQDWTEIPALTVVNFELDSAIVDQSAREILKKNVGILKKLPNTVLIRVEGHCDQRGTVEYNLALGQRRADSVKSYYGIAGLPRNRIDTISYGVERPLCSESTEECWAKNRRAATKVKNPQPITVKEEDLE